MNASKIISDDMTLEEKLAAIDSAMAAVQVKAQDSAQQSNSTATVDDPALALMCEGCQ